MVTIESETKFLSDYVEQPKYQQVSHKSFGDFLHDINPLLDQKRKEIHLILNGPGINVATFEFIATYDLILIYDVDG